MFVSFDVIIQHFVVEMCCYQLFESQLDTVPSLVDYLYNKLTSSVAVYGLVLPSNCCGELIVNRMI